MPLLASKAQPRCYYRVDAPPQTVELHGFSDASEKAYAAVVYVRSTYHDHPPFISLITSKTRVAPLKPLSIPRLELCGAGLLASLIPTVCGILQVPLTQVYAWTDSTIVLSWLDGNPRHYKTFVGNRIATILKAIPPPCWRHVPTADNPSDCASRGMLPKELLSHNLWWDGHSWLMADLVQMPWQPPRKPLSTPELRVVCNLSSLVPPEWIEGKCSSYHQLITVTAWCQRFIYRLKHGRLPFSTMTGRHLNPQELATAEQFLVSLSQSRSFPKEVHTLTQDKPIANTSKLKSLSPYIDKHRLLRVGGRLSNSALTQSQTHPLITDSKDKLMLLLFNHMHVCLGHCGPSLLLCITGRKFHVLSARRLSRTVCKQCVTCRRVSAKTQQQMMRQLPAARVNPSPSFSVTGVDYAGPFILKKGHTRRPVLIKAYIAVFVCFASKTTHLEIVSDLTTEAFLAALKRFVARRGLPGTIHSDNGSNFKGVKNDLQELYKFLQSTSNTSAISHYLLTHRIHWDTIPERAPHFGELWEAAVKAAKFHLKRIVGTQRLTFEELTTISCQIEACLNSRPLTVITSHDSDGISTLTPGHLLIGRPLVAYPETIIPPDLSITRRWTKCQAMVQHFWQRWAQEYLQQLQALTKWRSAKPNLVPGDVVIIRGDQTFTCQWPLARVLQTYPGQDGLVRVALLKTATSTLKRPISKLALLHRDSASQETPQVLSSRGSMFGQEPSQGKESAQDQASTAAEQHATQLAHS